MGERKGTKGLELWCRKMTEGYPGVKIDNMTTSWRDGLAFCAIIHHFRPDLIDFDKLNKADIYHNNELAYRVAEHHLGIPALLEAEDMVEYEVPDRLSILTYLSQFYQFFENQRGKSGARIASKRPQTTPDHGIVSPASTSPPTKVQITIGRAKREPCAKCGLPVFIAERLNVGKLLYHRTCFRCARCNSQLTLANYYETENGEFCCEICPDEEKLISKKLSSEHAVLMRSMSDEEKSASLQTYSEAPDAYSTHFEVALEYPIDGELKKNFTLTSVESTARSHFFKSQIEDSSDSSSEDIPPDLPASKPPPLVNNISSNKTNSELVFRDSSFPSDKKNTNEGSDSVSEQTNNHFVTKDNASSTSGVSVRARMKLFENNKDKKSDVNSFSSSKQVPFDATPKKKATVVAIDDLEDFDNISRKDIKIDDITLDNRSNNKVYSDKVKDEGAEKSIVLEEKIDKPKDSKLDFSQNNTLTSNIEVTINSNNIDIDTKKQLHTSSVAKYEMDATLNQKTQHNEISEISPISIKSQDSMTEFQHNSQEQETSVISIESEKEQSRKIVESEKSYISIKDSPVKNNETSVITVSDDSFLSADNVFSPQTISPDDGLVPKRGYYTAYEIAPPSENDSLLENSDTFSSSIKAAKEIAVANNIISPEKKSSFNDTEGEILSPAETDNMLENADISLPSEDEVGKENTVNKIQDSEEALLPYNNSMPSCNETQEVKSLEEIIPTKTEYAHNEDLLTEETISPSKNSDNSIETAISELAENKLTIVNTDTSLTKQEMLSEENKVIVSLNKLENDLSKGDETGTPPQELSRTESPKDKEHLKSSTKLQSDYPETLNPFDDESEDESSAISTSLNPFGEPDEEEVVVAPKPIPAARPKKKIIPSLEEREFKGTPEALSRIYIQRISLNPFEDDDDEDEKVEEPVLRKPVPSPRQRKKISLPRNLYPFESDEDEDMIVPVPAPRVPKISPARPEPKTRDTLSITSGGSHGGSNSSISSGSVVGSARKKKPAPRPPVPFRHSELPSGPTSLTVSPNTSAAQSPNLSGTIRSRKLKRAPLPPNASTPNTDRKDACETSAIDISPLSVESSEISPTKTSEEHAQTKKNVKDEENRNRQSHNLQEDTPSNEIDSNITTLNKSQSGRWKRRKGQAPSRPIPQRRTIKSLPMSEIKRELDTIEIQQQGLEKQGVRLEQIIREKCEGEEGNHADDSLPIEVEDLILQLFELVNEKNELFRRQAELMYLRRQQRLEEEHADVEYQIRCIINEPDANKTDSDKAREEALINRLVEIVERRNEIIECLEMDRVREAEEDNSISSQLNLYSLKRDGEKEPPTEQGKKEKKKKHKKISKIIHTLKHKEKEKEKGHKVDIDKDVDETEVSPSSEKKKKKKFNIF